MKSTRILAIIVAAALPNAVLHAQPGPPWMKDNPPKVSEMHQKMETERKAQDAEIDKLVTEMNSATGDRKMDAMAALLTKIVDQRKAMREKMDGMHMEMNDAMECCKQGMGKQGTGKHDMMKNKMNSPTPGMH